MIRKFARPMLASVYIADGIDTVAHTQDHVEGAEAVIKRTKAILPREYAKKVPQDPELVARSVGGVKIGAGSLLALGKLPRLSATALAITAVPTILSRYAFWETQDKKEKAERRSGFATHVALLGGLAITSVDTEGKPGLKWRAGQVASAAGEKVQAALPTKSDADGFVDNAKTWISDTTEQAREFVDENKEGWIETAQAGAAKVSSAVSDYAQQAKGFVDENKDDWLASAKNNAEAAKNRAVKAAAAAQDRATAAYTEAEKKSGRDSKKLSKKASKLQKRADKALSKAQRKLKNIQL